MDIGTPSPSINHRYIRNSPDETVTSVHSLAYKSFHCIRNAVNLLIAGESKPIFVP